MLPFMSSSGLSPGSREAEVQRARVCLNCMEPIGLIGQGHRRKLVENIGGALQNRPGALGTQFPSGV